MSTEAKPWYKSKTIRFNVISGLLMGAEVHLELLRPIMGESVYGIALFVITMGNVYFRTITTSPIK